MKIKVFELRDEGTHIGIFAIKPEHTPATAYELSRNGFPVDSTAVIVGYLNGGQISTDDPYDWPGRTLRLAHLYIEEHFDELEDGQVIDVRVLLGERETPVESDRFYRFG